MKPGIYGRDYMYMKNIKDIWKDENFLSQNLNIEDIKDLLEYITPWLKNMEIKFCWDYSINSVGLSLFIDSAMREMYKIVNEEYKEEYELYPKQRDFMSMWKIISECHINDYIVNYDCIWELIRDKIFEIAKEVLY